jgi:hypothetical protein
VSTTPLFAAGDEVTYRGNRYRINWSRWSQGHGFHRYHMDRVDSVGYASHANENELAVAPATCPALRPAADGAP